MKIGIIGAGSGGLALAAELKRAGHSVHLWNRSLERLRPILANDNVIQVNDTSFGCYEVTLDFVSSNFGETVRDIEAAIVITPSSAHEDLGERFARLDRCDFPVILMPGRTYGSYAFIKHFKAYNSSASICCIETQTLLHACRADGCAVTVFGTKKKVAYSSLEALPLSQRSVIEAILPTFDYEPAYFDVALNNVGAFFHPIPTILNSGWIESKKGFKYYKEGISRRIASYLNRIDEEKQILCEQIGVKHIPLCDWLRMEYGSQGNGLYENIQSVIAYQEIDAPTTLDHRYVFDDINTGLIPLYKTAAFFSVPMPTLRIFLDFACDFLDTDFLATGRDFPAEYWKV